MRRACKISLKFATAKKRRHIRALLQAYRAAVNFYIRSLWNIPGGLDRTTLSRLRRTRLSERYKSQALKQAINIVVSTRKAAKKLGKTVALPRFHGAAVLDSKFVRIEEGKKSFDLIIRLSGLHKGHRLIIPTKRTAVLNKWMNKPGAKLIQGCALKENEIILWVELPDEPIREHGEIIGIDIGVNKLLMDSKGNQYGGSFKKIRDKIIRRVPGSKGRKRAYAERRNYIEQVLNSLPWDRLKVIGVENLKNLKRGKKKNRGKRFRRAVAPWIYRYVLRRLEDKAQENRVHLVFVSPAYTSQICPKCGKADENNRRGENFLCSRCGHTADADYIGAQNILDRTVRLLGSVESPRLKKAI